jgi:hypothetical protein
VLGLVQIDQLQPGVGMLLLVAAEVFDDAALDEAQAVLLNKFDGRDREILIMLAADLFFSTISWVFSKRRKDVCLE